MTVNEVSKESKVNSVIHFLKSYMRIDSYKATIKRYESDYFVMTGNTVEKLISSYQNRAAKTALVIDDIGLQIIPRLYQEGLQEVTLCLTRIPTNKMNIVKFILTKYFPEIRVNIIHLDDIKEGMNFDLIMRAGAVIQSVSKDFTQLDLLFPLADVIYS